MGRFVAVALVLAFATEAGAKEEAAGPPLQHYRAGVHFLRLGVEALGSASSLAVGYLHAHESGEARGGLGVRIWMGYGADVRAVGYDFGGFDGWLAYAVGHLDMLGDAGGMGLEIAAGGGKGPTGGQAAALGGVYFGAYFFDLGISYQQPVWPFDRPRWLSSLSMSIRIHAPLARHGVREWDEP